MMDAPDKVGGVTGRLELGGNASHVTGNAVVGVAGSGQRQLDVDRQTAALKRGPVML